MRILINTLLFLILSSVCMGQSLSDLQKKKQDAANEIEYTTRLLQEVQKNQRSSLSRLRLLNNKIDQRKTIISSINNEINVYQNSIEDNALVIELLSEDLDLMKEEYAKLIRSAYRNKNANDKILFLISAENVNQAYRRNLYLKRYTSYRRNQSEVIQNIQIVLNEKIEQLEEQKKVKQLLADETEKEARQLSSEQSQQDSEYKKLRKQQRTLLQKLKQQQRIEQQLEREIQRLIAEEAGKNKKEGGSGYELTPEQRLAGDNFEQNKNRLPWPVERGVIIEHFGMHQHPVLSNVQINNNGVNIATDVDSYVRSVFDGEVSRVFAISGGNSAVIIRHGKYLSVYSNLKEVLVKAGDKVSTKQSIGKVYFDSVDGNKSILKFQIWHENQKLNPEDWIVN